MLCLSSNSIYRCVFQDCEELSEWVQEKNITAQDETYRSAKTVHSKWTRHQAFEAEIASNKDRLFRIQQVNSLFVMIKRVIKTSASKLHREMIEGLGSRSVFKFDPILYILLQGGRTPLCLILIVKQ